MQLTFEQLERAMKPIEDIGRAELVFSVGTIPVTLQMLTPEEESEAQKFATVAIADDESFVAATSFLERLKLGVLSYALVKVADQDFRDGDGFIETGEMLGGKPVREPRYLAMRKLILRWPGSIRTAMFRKYTELLDIVEAKTEAAILFEPSDKEAEIERLQKRVDELKAELEPEKANGFAEILKVASEIEDTETAIRKGTYVSASPVVEQPAPEEPVVEQPAPEEPVVAQPEQQPEVRQQRKSIIPEVAVPPVVTRQAPPQDQNKAPQSMGFEEDSFVDMSDPEAVEQAMSRESARLMAMRRGVPIAEPPSALMGNRGAVMSRPPHLDALDVATQQPEELGTVDGHPVFRMPVQELTTDAPKIDPKKESASLNASQGGKQSRNPRFQSSKS